MRSLTWWVIIGFTLIASSAVWSQESWLRVDVIIDGKIAGCLWKQKKNSELQVAFYFDRRRVALILKSSTLPKMGTYIQNSMLIIDVVNSPNN